MDDDSKPCTCNMFWMHLFLLALGAGGGMLAAYGVQRYRAKQAPTLPSIEPKEGS